MSHKNYTLKLSRIYRGCPEGGTPSLTKAWRIDYELNGKRKQTSGGINYKKTVKEREAAAQDLKKVIDEIILQSFNKRPRKGVMPLKAAYEFAFDKAKSNWGKTHLQVEKSRKTWFLKAIKTLGIEDIPLTEFDRIAARELLEWIRTKRKLSNHSYIRYKTIFKGIFSVLQDWEIIENNPFMFKAAFKMPSPKAKIILDEQERKQIRDHLMKLHPRFFYFCMVHAFTGMRPVEILRLRISDLNMTPGKEHFYLKAEQAKDDEDRYVVIPDVLIPYIQSLKLNEYPSDWFIFGTGFVPQKRDESMPSQEASDLWKHLIKWPAEKGGLGINKNLYWLKDWGSRMWRIAGVPEETVQEQLGHASYKQSKVYIGKYLPEGIEKLKKNTPDF